MKITKNELGQKVKGRGPFKSTWYSLCKSHFGIRAGECDDCNIGMWRNNLFSFIDFHLMINILPVSWAGKLFDYKIKRKLKLIKYEYEYKTYI